MYKLIDNLANYYQKVIEWFTFPYSEFYINSTAEPGNSPYYKFFYLNQCAIVVINAQNSLANKYSNSSDSCKQPLSYRIQASPTVSGRL